MLVVSDPTLPGMRDTMRLVNLFKKTAPKTDICVALNRVGANKNGELSKGDFERGAEVKVNQIIPSDPKAFAASASTGKPLAKVEKSGKTTAAIRELGMTIAKLKAEPAKTSVWQKLIKGKK
jgi:pilus assembly protein CpaE